MQPTEAIFPDLQSCVLCEDVRCEFNGMNTLVGVLNVQSEERRDFGPADIDFLKAIAGQVAGILERMELQRRLEAQLAEIRLSHEIHERFTQLSLDGAGIPAILAGVGALAGGRAALYSTDGFRVRGGTEDGDALPSRM